MKKLFSPELQLSALHCLAGVVSAHLARRGIDHLITQVDLVYYFNLECESLEDVELDRLIKVVRGFNGSFRIECASDVLVLVLYL